MATNRPLWILLIRAISNTLTPEKEQIAFRHCKHLDTMNTFVVCFKDEIKSFTDIFPLFGDSLVEITSEKKDKKYSVLRVDFYKPIGYMMSSSISQWSVDLCSIRFHIIYENGVPLVETCIPC